MFTNFLITLYLFDFFPRLTDDLFRYSGSGPTKPVQSPAGDRTPATMTHTTPFMQLLAKDMLPDQARGSSIASSPVAANKPLIQHSTNRLPPAVWLSSRSLRPKLRAPR